MTLDSNAPPSGHRTIAAILVVAGAAGSLLIWWATSHGPGVSPDSAIYIGTARNVLAGRGLVFDGAPMNHFPPLYPLMLALVGLLTHDATLAARLLAAIGFGANIALLGATVFLAADRSVRVTLIALLLFTVSGSTLYLHAMAWSEAPFFFFTLSGLLSLAASITYRRPRLLMLAAMFCALAMMTRYVGVTLLAPLLVTVLFLGDRTRRERLRDLLVAGAIAIGSLGALMIRNHLVAQTATDRVLAVHPVDADQIVQMVTTLNDFLLPLNAGTWFAGILVVGFAVLLCGWVAARHREQLMRRATPSLAGSLALVSLLFTGGYLGFVLFSISFLDATTPLDDRILFPVFGVVIVAMTAVASEWTRRLATPAVGWALAAGAALSIACRWPGALAGVAEIHRDGVGYLSETWRRSDMLAQVRRLPPETVVYSNAQDAIEFLTGRTAQWLPDEEIWESAQPNPAFAGQRDTMCREVINGTAVVAYFNTEDPGDEWALAQTAAMCSFPVMTRRSDGAFYSARSALP